VTEERSNDWEGRAMRQVVIAALRYRDAMRRYMAGQVTAIDGGATLDELLRRNQAGFQAAARAEEELFALLDTLERMQAYEGGRQRPESEQR
jgi:hypothetical protein